MTRDERRHPLGLFARAGFLDLSAARTGVLHLEAETACDAVELIETFALAADPDTALRRISAIAEAHPEVLRGLGRQEWERLTLLVGSSPALGDFFLRRPERLGEILRLGGRLIGAQEARAELLRAVGASAEGGGAPVAALPDEAGWIAMRVRYRELLAELMLYDLRTGVDGAATTAFDDVAAVLSDLAAAALEAGLAVARAGALSGAGGVPVPPERLAATRLAVVAMGKCGARELNVVSDVDVMFVAEAAPVQEGSAFESEAVLRIATRLAADMMRAVHDPALEPPLWQVDANLRPEGRHGPLVRTLGSMLSYYERWGRTWEFQALLKARPIAGDLALGGEFVERTRPMVWSSSAREDFVGSVQRMRERVTEHIADDELEVQVKLGPGGLRDIEFSVQLLQLVHGQYDDRLHLRGTIPALAALVDGGYVARSDGERLAADYRSLRVLEHRLQLRELRRTALMPREEEDLRILARASRLAATAGELVRLWQGIKQEVRRLHLKIFYAPLLSAVASLPDEELVLGSEEARARLHSIGFRDPEGAMRHLAALTRGTSRNARIQRNLLPVLLQWLAEGTDPDHGLLAFRRVSEANRETPWYLRLLRDGSEAAERLTLVLSNSRFAAELLESVPEAVAWLERDELLRPVPLEQLRAEMRALVSRRDGPQAAAEALRTVHRREVLRLALGRLTLVNDEADVAVGLDAAHTALIDGLLLALERAGAEPRDARPAVPLALIAMGRYGGQELGFASDIDLIAVYRAPEGMDPQQLAAVARTAERTVAELKRLVEDPRFPVDLDFDLRPEGRNGPLVRSLDSYRAYYERWSLTWEAQALLRARPVAGDPGLGADFIALADAIRYPETFSESDVREVRRIKARVESERLPRGVDPKRHLKLGPGGISDVEWLVQLLQLEYGAHHAALRTSSTLGALSGAVEAGVLDGEAREQLEASWSLASSIRSAIKLWSGRGGDALPVNRSELEGIAGVLGLPSGRTTEIEEQWFAAARRARAVFERDFFGYSDRPATYPLILPRG
ncbi:bifunctional [glutamine synthetase] adenylyltransferase/[glutamine synthetase]-adenylyl-L-tyrosine phosphorylase [Leucobacter weissii]|uniref:Bifunctional [glutamine synthetase] adenylyltransferase/[glutamine synthetase]-adenylyl-L-tyrosine phosphorylase n=1 Tax=Leucobacter weissii TaxID=1983706 RepID=A0A939MRX4_9MICO|nr:bifunctional [glutamine synthetase] adenylyltransferase/[glutamine synthetase]-adenylyl-L-tyrosine phosphorylase [Leucobacter weissii]MBO1901894.1 bifunctional [glutamine synthetase] adenylyltransferase/[glutamine synthetase]-adenylyl-L-tyrosine phosphorylase [Leucobacter weissii]